MKSGRVIQLSQLPSFTRRELLATAVSAASAAFLKAQPPQASSGFFRAPTLHAATGGEVTVIWALPALADNSLVIGDAAGHAAWFPAKATRFDPDQTGLSQPYYQYQATATGLALDTPFTYQIWVNGRPMPNPFSRSPRFRTGSDAPFPFLCFADSGDHGGIRSQIAARMQTENAALVLANGDFAYDVGSFDNLEANYFGVFRELMAAVPFFAALGNHEYYSDFARPALAGRMSPASEGVPLQDRGRYYSFDRGNVHFVALDSNWPLFDAVSGKGEMLRWLEADLSRTRRFWKVVFFHHPGFAAGKHQDEPEAGLVRQYIAPILEAHGVQLVFNGHEHTYQRTHELRAGRVVPRNSGGIVYVTSGGGGSAPEYFEPTPLIAASIGANHYVRAEVAGPQITLRIRGLDEGADLDTWTLEPAPQIDETALVPAAGVRMSLNIKGRNLFPFEVKASPSSALFEAHGCSLTADGVPLAILKADACEITAQLPESYDAGRESALLVTTPNGTAAATIAISKVALRRLINK